MQARAAEMGPESGGKGGRAMSSEQCSAGHVTPAGGVNDSGITVEDNQSADCFSVRQDNHDGTEDLIHFCDWPALKAAIDRHQGERGAKI